MTPLKVLVIILAMAILVLMYTIHRKKCEYREKRLSSFDSAAINSINLISVRQLPCEKSKAERQFSRYQFGFSVLGSEKEWNPNYLDLIDNTAFESSVDKDEFLDVSCFVDSIDVFSSQGGRGLTHDNEGVIGNATISVAAEIENDVKIVGIVYCGQVKCTVAVQRGAQEPEGSDDAGD